MINRRVMFAVVVLLISIPTVAQRPRPIPRGAPRPDLHGPVELLRAVDIIKEWETAKTVQGARVCHFQAVLNSLIDVDNVMDPMQPNVSLAKALERLSVANQAVPKDNDSISYQLRALLITAGQLLDSHATPDIPAQKESFHRQVLEPAYRLVTPEVISFVEAAQEFDVALKAVSLTQSDISALILHAVHGDCSATDRDSRQ